MKKTLCLLCALLCCAALLVPAATADVIWEPQGDSFYESHREECEYLFRRYTANGPDGYLTLWKAPGSAAQVVNLPNGEVLGCTWLYTDSGGVLWGGAEYEGDWGWFRVSETVVVPDYLSFEEAHGDEFVPYDSAYDHAFDGLETVVLWTFPGSGEMDYDACPANWFTNNVTPAEAFQKCYVDGAGLFWGFTGYVMGSRNVWICLSDPANTELAADETVLPVTGLVPTAEEIPAPANVIPWVAAALVVLVVAGTAVLIPLVCRRKKG